MKKSTYEAATQLARDLRKRQTRAEEILWENLRNRKLLGKKFLRQHPIFFQYEGGDAFFIADFYCHEQRLVIEVDGKIHDNQKQYDEFRTHIINNLGISVVRFKNKGIEDNLRDVLERLKGLLRLRADSTPSLPLL